MERRERFIVNLLICYKYWYEIRKGGPSAARSQQPLMSWVAVKPTSYKSVVLLQNKHPNFYPSQASLANPRIKGGGHISIWNSSLHVWTWAYICCILWLLQNSDWYHWTYAVCPFKLACRCPYEVQTTIRNFILNCAYPR